MKIVCITGTDIKGCTYNLKEIFLNQFRGRNEIVEFSLPKDAPSYCTGCKNCFFVGEDKCPHIDKVKPIWDAMLDSDLIVFVYPTYVLRAPAQVKAVLDHLGCFWFVHRPNPKMFTKKGFIISQGIGPVYKKAIKDVKTSLNWLGVSKVKALGFGLMEGVVWDELSLKRKNKMTKIIEKKTKKYKNFKPGKLSFKGKMLFFFTKMMHKMIYKGEFKKGSIGLDSQYWLDQGWIKQKH